MNKRLSTKQYSELLEILQNRFEQNPKRHNNLNWEKIREKLEANTEKLWSLYEMERTGGEPDVIASDTNPELIRFYDCSPESPKNRRSLCYDRQGQTSRKEFKPENNALDMAASMGIELLTEEQYRELQQFGKFDTKTSSWIKTPESVRKLGGALFADYRYGQVFVYHNSAPSYYAARGFRGWLNI